MVAPCRRRSFQLWNTGIRRSCRSHSLCALCICMTDWHADGKDGRKNILFGWLCKWRKLSPSHFTFWELLFAFVCALFPATRRASFDITSAPVQHRNIQPYNVYIPFENTSVQSFSSAYLCSSLGFQFILYLQVFNFEFFVIVFFLLQKTDVRLRVQKVLLH